MFNNNNNNDNNNNKLYLRVGILLKLAYKLTGDTTRTDTEIKCLRL